jgi:hypothetical protein
MRWEMADMPLSSKVQQLLVGVESTWDFPIFELEAATDGWPMVAIAMHLFRSQGVM